MKLSELFFDRFLYRDNNQNSETKDSAFVSADSSGSTPASVPAGGAAQDINTSNVQINGAQLEPGTYPLTVLDVSNWGWGQTCAFSSTDLDTVSWGVGTFKSADGTSYSISAGNTGNMAAKTYIYLSLLDSETVYQITTTPSTAVGVGKVLVAVANPDTVSATYNLSEATQLVGDNILANSINVSKLVAGQLIVGTNVGQGTARQNFTSTPTTPYYVGDLWSGGSTGDLKVCIVQRLTGAYNAADWDLASKYTDNTVANQALSDAATAIANAATAQGTADGKVTTFYQAAAPTAEGIGDLWIDTDDGNKLYRWSGAAWVAVQDASIGQAISDAADAQSTADGKIVSFYQDAPPTAIATGDFWTDTNDSNKLYRWSGAAWVSVRDTQIATNASNLSTLITDLGAVAYLDLVESAQLGTTVIVGGYIKSSLMTADNIVTGSLAGINMSIGTGNNIFKANASGISLGNATFASAPFNVDMAGNAKVSSLARSDWHWFTPFESIDGYSKITAGVGTITATAGGVVLTTSAVTDEDVELKRSLGTALTFDKNSKFKCEIQLTHNTNQRVYIVTGTAGAYPSSGKYYGFLINGAVLYGVAGNGTSGYEFELIDGISGSSQYTLEAILDATTGFIKYYVEGTLYYTSDGTGTPTGSQGYAIFIRVRDTNNEARGLTCYWWDFWQAN